MNTHWNCEEQGVCVCVCVCVCVSVRFPLHCLNETTFTTMRETAGIIIKSWMHLREIKSNFRWYKTVTKYWSCFSVRAITQTTPPPPPSFIPTIPHPCCPRLQGIPCPVYRYWGTWLWQSQSQELCSSSCLHFRLKVQSLSFFRTLQFPDGGISGRGDTLDHLTCREWWELNRGRDPGGLPGWSIMGESRLHLTYLFFLNWH